MVLNENTSKKIIPVAGGKGGVGKSFIAVNLALALAANGYKTILIDLDLGSSNLHTFLGFRNNNQGIGTYLVNKRQKLEDLVIGTPHDNLYFIPGDVQQYGVATLPFQIVKKLSREITTLDADYIIMDLGSGSSFNILDFFLTSNAGILVTTPQKTSTGALYDFLKNLVIRFCERAFDKNKAVSDLIKELVRESRPGQCKSIKPIIEKIADIDPESAEKMRIYLSVLQPKMIINQSMESTAAEEGEKMASLFENNFNLNIESIGMLLRDPYVDLSIEERNPYILSHPNNVLTKQITRIAQKIIQSEEFPFMPFDYSYYENSFDLSRIEFENDVEQIEQIEQK